MTILVDTNVLPDIFLKREPHASMARIIMTKCAEREIIGYIAAHSIPNIFYILRKTYTPAERRVFLRNLCEIFRVSDLNTEKIKAAIENEEFADFEDCLQEECAVEAMADYIVTRNLEDYKESRVKAIEPEAFVSLL